MKTVPILFFALLITCSFITPIYAEQASCYLQIEKSAGLDPAVIQNTTLPVLNQYVDSVETIPLEGVRADDCRYTVELTRSEGSLFISLSGRKINAIASSDDSGMKGFTQALLRAVHKTFTAEAKKNRICQAYPSLLAADCRVIESLFYIYDENGKKIENGNTVQAGDRFHVLIKPLTPLYAYVISKDSNDNLFRIFPNRHVTDIPNPLNANFPYYFPPVNSDLVFEFDDNPGIEKFYFVFSAVPLREITRYFSGKNSVNVQEFEKEILTRGIKLAKKQKAVTVEIPNMGTEPKKVEDLKGKGVILKEIVLQHR